MALTLTYNAIPAWHVVMIIPDYIYIFLNKKIRNRSTTSPKMMGYPSSISSIGNKGGRVH